MDLDEAEVQFQQLMSQIDDPNVLRISEVIFF